MRSSGVSKGRNFPFPPIISNNTKINQAIGTPRNVDQRFALKAPFHAFANGSEKSHRKTSASTNAIGISAMAMIGTDTKIIGSPIFAKSIAVWVEWNEGPPP